MSKEVETRVDGNILGEREVTQEFSFWAKLVDEYPPKTTTMTEQYGHAWQPLANTRLTNPPRVELIE